jgi:hypothetical protein
MQSMCILLCTYGMPWSQLLSQRDSRRTTYHDMFATAAHASILVTLAPTEHNALHSI